MISVDGILVYVFALFCAVGGTFNLLFTKKVIMFRQKFFMGTSWLSGGFFYRTEFRVRMIGVMLLFISALIIALK